MAAAICYGVGGGGAQLCFHIRAGNYDTDSLIEVLEGQRRFLGGQKATLLWDGLPAHRSTAMHTWIATQRSWLVAERPPTRQSSTRLKVYDRRASRGISIFQTAPVQRLSKSVSCHFVDKSKVEDML
jgi:hypothetical protein